MKRLIKTLLITALVLISSALLFACGTKSEIRYTLIDSGTSYEVSGLRTATNVSAITIPATYKGLPVTSIGDSAFSYCTSLSNITIPDSVIYIERHAFSHCTSLSNITIPDSVTNIGFDAFSYCTSLTNIIIPDSVTNIGGGAFSYCTSLSSITIPDSVTFIGIAAFSSCESLTNITIPDSVTSIGQSTFYNCISLTSLTIPDSVTSIGNMAFLECTNLTIYCEAESKPDEWYEHWNDSSHPYDLNRPVIWGCTFNSETGTYVVSFTKTEDSILNPNEYTINAPYREGYTFGGWAITPDGTKEFDAADIAAAPNGTTLYAIWIPN